MLLLLLIISIYSTQQGIKESKQKLNNIEEFKKAEASFFDNMKHYKDHSYLGFRIIHIPGSSSVFFSNPVLLSELSARINTITILDIGSNCKGGLVLRGNSPFAPRFSNVVRVLASLLILFLGFEIMREREFLQKKKPVNNNQQREIKKMREDKMTDEENKSTVGSRVKKIRKELNIKGKDFAPRLKISGPSLSEIEKGKYYPNFEFMANISREFNVNLYYLIFGEGDMFIDPGKQTALGLLEELVSSSSHIRKFLYYFERSDIIRFFILSQFKHKLMLDREMIEKEISELEQDSK